MSINTYLKKPKLLFFFKFPLLSNSFEVELHSNKQPTENIFFIKTRYLVNYRYYVSLIKNNFLLIKSISSRVVPASASNLENFSNYLTKFLFLHSVLSFLGQYPQACYAVYKNISMSVFFFIKKLLDSTEIRRHNISYVMIFNYSTTTERFFGRSKVIKKSKKKIFFKKNVSDLCKILY